MGNQWYRQVENRIIGSIDKETKKRKEEEQKKKRGGDM